MKKQFAKTVSLLLAGLLSAGALSGCSESGNDASSSEASETAAQTVTSGASDASGDNAESEQPTDSLEARQLVDDGLGEKGDGDIYGFAGEKRNATVAYLYSFELDVLRVNEDGTFDMLFGNDERSINGIEKLRTLLYDADGAYALRDWKDNYNMFVAEKALFFTSTIDTAATDFRTDCDFDYGIVPYPKYEESQQNYCTVAGGSVSCCAVPITVTRDELAGTLFAALSAETWKTVLPQYYDVVLKFKGARDETSIAMIDTILNGRSIDFEFIYDAFAGYVYKVGDILFSNRGLASATAKIGPVVKKHYETVLKLFYPDN